MNVKSNLAYKYYDIYKGKRFSSGFISQIEEYMLSNGILRIEIEKKKVFCYQHKTHSDYSIFIHGWLEGYITSKALTEFLKEPYQWVEYALKDFLNEVLNHAQKRA